MADVNANALYPQPPKQGDSLLSGDPSKIIGLVGAINQNKLFEQIYKAREGIGEAYKNAVGDDGTVDHAALMRGAAGAGFLAPDAVTAAQAQQQQRVATDTALFEQFAKQHDFTARGFAALRQKGDKLTPEDVHNWAVTMSRNTDSRAIPSNIISAMHKAILKDPGGLLSGVNTVANMVMGPTAAATQIEGPPGEGGATTSVPIGAIGYGTKGTIPGTITKTLPPGEAGTLEASATRAANLQATASTTAQYHADLENLKQDSKILDNLGGPTVDAEKKLNQLSQRLGGFGVTMTGDQLKALESFDKIANQISLNQAAHMAGTDAGRMMSVGANPNSGMSRYGREGVIDMLQGNQDAIDRTRNLWLAARANGAPANSHDLFVNRLSQVLDPRVFQFNRLNRENQQKFLNQIDPSELPDFEKKYQYAIDQKWVKPLKGSGNGR
jgi:hypothetical protein